jgi:hypothetical protein
LVIVTMSCIFIFKSCSTLVLSVSISRIVCGHATAP